eukprot:CAMPEP_0181206056 /NCGR_PEP_ID=MMETSP1096-20121128/20821_1 /TAXON_ID=156174 ORGANISM="Chrysochromulina ericina, Strain CCMP281" /NCGR_SAMPLE_ID=MMETSP1096 /ASSEMBLY_ACC=CAM_ASM_000453 /LENGTH=163 /DNA_ID=CAMNT_0023296909 /DNA_START=72 /DNA_END=564 /DNA_ORIENTATION=-
MVSATADATSCFSQRSFKSNLRSFEDKRGVLNLRRPASAKIYREAQTPTFDVWPPWRDHPRLSRGSPNGKAPLPSLFFSERRSGQALPSSHDDAAGVRCYGTTMRNVDLSWPSFPEQRRRGPIKFDMTPAHISANYQLKMADFVNNNGLVHRSRPMMTREFSY